MKMKLEQQFWKRRESYKHCLLLPLLTLQQNARVIPALCTILLAYTEAISKRVVL
jgi:hypothetical protein